MAFALSAAEAAEIALAANRAVVFGEAGAAGAEAYQLGNWAGAIGAGITGTLGLGTLGVMAARKRSRKSSSSKSNKKRKTTGSRSKSLNPRTGGFIGMDKKYVDLTATHTVVSTVSGSEVDPSPANGLVAIGQGNNQSQRIGNRVTLTEVHINGEILFNAVTAATPNSARYVRVLLVLDKQTNGAQLSGENVLKDPASATFNVMAWRDLEYVKRFQVLADIYVRRHNMAINWNGSNTLTSQEHIPFQIHKKLDLPINFSTTGSDVSAIVDNSLHMIAIGSNGVDASINYISRIRYYG